MVWADRCFVRSSIAHFQQEALLCHQPAREQRAHSTYASSEQRLARRERASPKYPAFVLPYKYIDSCKKHTLIAMNITQSVEITLGLFSRLSITAPAPSALQGPPGAQLV
jgi:hypothetical protein